jgi:hypothetical protein
MRQRYHVSAHGTLIGGRDGLYLADVVLASFPPQVGTGIEVRGLSFGAIPQMEGTADLYWTSKNVVVMGSIENDVLVAEVVLIDGVTVWQDDKRHNVITP